VRGKGDVCVHLRAVGFLLRHHADVTRDGHPAGFSVKARKTFHVLAMDYGDALVRRFLENVDGEFLIAECCDCAFLNARSDFLQGIRATDCGEIFVEQHLGLGE